MHTYGSQLRTIQSQQQMVTPKGSQLPKLSLITASDEKVAASVDLTLMQRIDTAENQDNKSIDKELKGIKKRQIEIFRQKQLEMGEEIALLKKTLESKEKAIAARESECEHKMANNDAWLAEQRRLDM